MKIKNNSIILCVGATLAFWVAVFIGPVFVLLLNNLGYYVSGTGWGQNSFMYKVLTFLSQPIACVIAYSIAKAISKDKHPVCVLVNTIVCTCMCVLFAIVASSTTKMLQMIISAVICIVMAVVEAKEVTPKKQETL